MSKETEFLHDLINKLSIAHGNMGLIIKKPENFQNEKLVEFATMTRAEIDKAIELIEQRRKEIKEIP